MRILWIKRDSYGLWLFSHKPAKCITNGYKYFPNEFSSYEEYVKYLKEKGFAIDATGLNIY